KSQPEVQRASVLHPLLESADDGTSESYAGQDCAPAPATLTGLCTLPRKRVPYLALLWFDTQEEAQASLFSKPHEQTTCSGKRGRGGSELVLRARMVDPQLRYPGACVE
ncbi:MAG: hypothetical protein RR482_07985, partial [Clostridia bacterium]